MPESVLRHAVWLSVRRALRYRDVEDLLAERVLDISSETVRRWVTRFGPLFALELSRRRPCPTSRWHADDVIVTNEGKRRWQEADQHTVPIGLSRQQACTMICPIANR